MADPIFGGQALEAGTIRVYDADLFGTLIFEDLAGEDDMSLGLIGDRRRWDGSLRGNRDRGGS